MKVFFLKCKYLVIVFLFIYLTFSLSAQDVSGQLTAGPTGSISVSTKGPVPLLLEGIWQNYSRYIVFDTDYILSKSQEKSEAEKAVPAIVLRTYYQWYADRAAEDEAYTKESARDRNNSVSAQVERIELSFTPLTDQVFTADYNMPVSKENGDILLAEKECSGAWDMTVTYSGHKIGGVNTYHVPIAVIGDKLYLNFKIKADDSANIPVSPLLDGTVNESGNMMAGFWKDQGNANGILVSQPITNTELLSYLVTDTDTFLVRYWETDMEFDSDAKARIDFQGKSYTVPKHILSAGKTYACTLGRRTQVRNVVRTDTLPEPYTSNSVLVEKHAVTSEGKSITYKVRIATICAFGQPYLTLTEGSRTLQEIIALDNSRRKPLPPSPFPAHGVLDFDWSIVEHPPKDWNRRMLDLGK